jgi:Kinesin motor domain
VRVDEEHHQITLYEYYFVNKGMDMPADPNMYAEHTFSFDYIYSEESSQEEVYDNTAKESVLSVLEGYNSTILAYG